MRHAINNLQATHTGFGEITKEGVFRICDVPNIDALNQILDECLRGNLTNVRILIIIKKI